MIISAENRLAVIEAVNYSTPPYRFYSVLCFPHYSCKAPQPRAEEDPYAVWFT